MNRALKKQMFICFTGIDGSGKSTLARKVVAELEQRGVKSKYVYCRFLPVLLRPIDSLGRAAFLRGKDAFRDYAEYSNSKRALFGKSPLRLIYECLLLTDYFFQIMYRLGLPLILGKNIVCDRYVYDTIITDLAVQMSYSPEKVRRVLRRYLFFVPKPDVVFLVDVPEEVAYQRKDDVPSIDYLKERRKIYLDVAQSYAMTVLDGSRDLAELVCEVEKGVFT